MPTKTLQRQAVATKPQVQPQVRKRGVATTWAPITVVLCLATFLYSYRIESEGLWLDELTSLQDASLAPLAAYLENQLRPLYYFLLKGWMHLGNSDGWLRSLAALFALISVFLTYRLGRRLVGEAEGIIAALLLTVSPLVINHAQEIRMYTVSLCLSLAGTLFLADALLTEHPKKPSQKSLAGWTLFRLLAIYTVPLNITLLLADGLIVLARFYREKSVLASFAKWLMVLIALWSPSVLSVIQESSPSGSYASHHVSATPPGADNLFRQLKFWTVWPSAKPENVIAAQFYKVFTLGLSGLLGASLLRKHKSATLLWTLVWLIVPLLPIVVFSYLVIPIWQSRYLLFVSPFLFILLASGLTRLWQQWKISAITFTAAYLIAAGGGLFHYYTVQERPDYKYNIATIEEYQQPGDALVWSYHYKKPLGHYYDGGADIHWRTLKEVQTPEDINQWISSFPTGYERWWLTLDSSRRTDEQALESAIAQNYTVERSFDYALGSKVMLLTPRSETVAIEPAP
ncbi:MAG: glycosyltransferase family 39 protein [Cyanobacteria bacterium J06632_3]